MSKQKKLTPWMIENVTKMDSRPKLVVLTESQKKNIATTARILFSVSDWQRIETGRRDFAWCRWAKPQAIEYKPFANRLKAIADSANELLTALSGEKPNRDEHGTSYPIDATALLLWQELTLGESSLKSLFEVFAMLHALEKAARRALLRTNEWSEKDAWKHDWDGLVDLLASVFEANGVKPTAAKSSRAQNPKPSRFVNFVWAILQTLPREFRTYERPEEAMAKAVADAIAFRRSQTAGPKTSAA